MTEQHTIDLSDLHNPLLSPLQEQARSDAEAHPVTISAEQVLQSAMEQTGLSNFGAQDFHERLELWVKAINDDKGASALTRINMLQMYTRYAATRLRLEDLIERHPQILDIEIDRPIIVAGLPRSGTTHLLSLISADSRLRSLPWWEAIDPIPHPDDKAGPDGIDPRWHRAEAGWQMQDAMLPHLKSMHSFSPDHISEDIELQALDFSSYLIEWLAMVPQWRDYYLQHDQSGTYSYLKRALQALTFLKGPNRWVLKCPQHMEQLPIVHKTFPDATIVITHRDPVASIQSAITMSLYGARMLRKSIEPQEFADYWIDRYATLLSRCTRDRDSLPEEQVIDVYFDKLMQDTDGVLQDIYARADLPLPAETLAELHAYIDSNPRGKYGKVVYNLRRDFKLEPEQVRARFGFYLERFPVSVEVK
jgi:Sulfotransferase family